MLPGSHFATINCNPAAVNSSTASLLHYAYDRPLTHRECARAQGLPDCVVLQGNVAARYRMVGNAVPPPLAAAVARELVHVLVPRAPASSTTP